jgi:hypothetical protein
MTYNRVLTAAQHDWVRAIKGKQDQLRRACKRALCPVAREEARRQLALLPTARAQAEGLGVDLSTINRVRSGKVYVTEART